MSPPPEIFLGRQPIVDRDQQLLAYELLFRNGLGKNEADVADPVQATATVIAHTFSELAVGDALGPYRGFINLDQTFLFSDLVEVLPKQSVVLEILETVEPTPEVLARCRELAAKGFTLAVDDVVQTSAAYRPLLELAEIIKVDVQCLDAEELTRLTAQLKPLGKRLLAEKVETREQMRRCHDLGYELFQGYYFARPTVIAGKRLNPAEISLTRLLGLVLEDAETVELERAFKQEAGLTLNLLRLTNSVANGMTVKVTSLRHAITLLGRRQLQRWLQLLLFTNPKGGSSHTANPLLQLAATRGRLMELLAEHLQPRDRDFADHAFMVGILSLIPALLGVPTGELLTQLPVVPKVRQALTGYGGTLGALLQLIESTEQTKFDATLAALQRLPSLTLPIACDCLAQAMRWANHLGQTDD